MGIFMLIMLMELCSIATTKLQDGREEGERRWLHLSPYHKHARAHTHTHTVPETITLGVEANQ